MKLVTVTPPRAYPVTLDQARTQCRVLDESHDEELLRLVQAATASVEVYLGARIMEQTVRLELGCFPDSALSIDLGVYPVTSVDSLTYIDTAGDEQTLVEGTDYWTDGSGQYPTLAPVDSWPETQEGRPAAVNITMTAGWEDPTAVPADIAQAILLAVGYNFDNSQDKPDSTYLLSPHRRLVL